MAKFRLAAGDELVVEWLNEHGVVVLHVVNPQRAPAAEWYERQMGKAGERAAILDWQDTDGDQIGFHLVMAWRLNNMNGRLMVMKQLEKTGDGKKDLVDAVGQVSVRYMQKFGRWPDRALMRAGPVMPPSVMLKNAAGAEIQAVEMVYVTINFPKGYVAVYHENGGSNG